MKIGTGRLSRRTVMIGGGAAFAGSFARRAEATLPVYDVAIYGATPSGIIAAYTAAQHGQRVALLYGFSGFGGMVAGGLGRSDVGHPSLVGGNALRFFKNVGKQYKVDGPVWHFEPHVARKVFIEMLASAKIDTYLPRLKEGTGVSKVGRTITTLNLEDGTIIQAKQFIDASYEGDLMAQAGVSYVVGRESTAAYGETLAGFNRYPDIYTISPRNPSTGKLYYGVLPQTSVLTKGAADKSVQAYGYRLCLSDDPTNMVPFTKPLGYDPDQYQIAKQLYLSFKPLELPNSKFDVNANAIVGGSLAYADANYATRSKIALANKRYQQGYLWTLATDPAIPSSLRSKVNSYGLAKDEFTDYGNWPNRAFYLREGRRMIGEYVFRQQDTQTAPHKKDPIALGGWFVDCHVCGYYELRGKLLVEGYIDVSHSQGLAATTRPFQIPYRSIVPKGTQATNLWVTCCLSATHIGYEPLRIEWIYMSMGEAAATAAVLANHGKVTAQNVPYTELASKLKANGVVL